MRADAILEAVSDAIAVKNMILTGDKLRLVVSDNAADYLTLRANPIVTSLISTTPDLGLWRIIEHCASVTRLYALFERFIVKIVKAWLADIPSICGPYGSLSASFKTVHRRGVAKVLMDLDKDRFSTLGIPNVLDGLLKAVNGDHVYSVLPEAFLNDTRSLKRDRIDELFSHIGLEGGWDWVARNRHVVTFIDQVRGGQNTADAELRTFINYRNEAAHGSVDQVLGVGPLTEYVDFIVSVCRATEELFRWNWIRKGEVAGRTKKAGRVTERFKENIVVAKLTNCRIEQGMNVVLFGDGYCYPVTVESLQLNGVPQAGVTVESETEVGLKLDKATQSHPYIFLEVPITVADQT